MKKYLILITIIASVFILISCKNNDNDISSNNYESSTIIESSIINSSNIESSSESFSSSAPSSNQKINDGGEYVDSGNDTWGTFHI